MPYILTLYVFAAIAITGNAFVIIAFLRNYSLRALTTKVIFLIHFSSLLDGIINIPLVFTHETIFCEAIGFLQYYFGLLNIGALMILTLSYYNLIDQNSITFDHNLAKYGYILLYK